MIWSNRKVTNNKRIYRTLQNNKLKSMKLNKIDQVNRKLKKFSNNWMKIQETPKMQSKWQKSKNKKVNKLIILNNDYN